MSAPGAAPARGACRLGLRYVDGLRRATIAALAAERERGGPFRDVDELVRRTGLRGAEIEKLASIGALASLGLGRRAALWQAALAVRPTGPLFNSNSGAAHQTRNFDEADRQEGTGISGFGELSPNCPLPEMTPYEETVADFAGTGLTTGAHPMAYWREALARRRVIPTAELPRRARGERVRIAGAVIVRQRPGTAKGTLFLTVEDETGMAQAIVSRPLLQKHRPTIVGNPGLVIEGTVEAKDGSVSVRAERFWPLRHLIDTPSHDFR